MPTDAAGRSSDPVPTPASLALPPPRAIATIVATVLGLVLLFSFKTPDELPAPIGSVGVVDTPLPRATPRQGPAGGATPAPTSSGRPSTDSGQIDGDVVQTQFGDIQVRVIESGGKIVEVKALQLPFDRRRSNEISQYVAPILRSETLQAQSAQIDTISGATYTSDAYRQSLQSALDRAHG